MHRVSNLLFSQSRNKAFAGHLLVNGENLLQAAWTHYEQLHQNAMILATHRYWPALVGMDFSIETDPARKIDLENAATSYSVVAVVLDNLAEELDTVSLEAERLIKLVKKASLKSDLRLLSSNASRTARELENLPHSLTPQNWIRGAKLNQTQGDMIVNWLKKKLINVRAKANRPCHAAPGDPDPLINDPLPPPDIWQANLNEQRGQSNRIRAARMAFYQRTWNLLEASSSSLAPVHHTGQTSRPHRGAPHRRRHVHQHEYTGASIYEHRGGLETPMHHVDGYHAEQMAVPDSYSHMGWTEPRASYGDASSSGYLESSSSDASVIR